MATGSSLELWRPRGTPRFSLLASGLYFDGWLAPTGSVTVWPDVGGRAQGPLALELSLPGGTERTPLLFRIPGIERRVTIVPGNVRRVRSAFSSAKPWRLVFKTTKEGVLSDGRAISVQPRSPSCNAPSSTQADGTARLVLSGRPGAA